MASKPRLHPPTALRADPNDDDRPERSRLCTPIVTGRNAQEEFCALAERMTKGRPVKYPFEGVLRAQPEIDS